MKKLLLPALALTVLGLVACTPKAEGGDTPAGGGTTTMSFATEVQPILTKNCVSCHSGDRPAEGLDLTSYASMSKGAHGNPIFVAGKSADSVIYKAVTANGAKQMPPTEKLADADAEKIKAWIDSGAAE
jgi:cytochrome c551/c552